MALAMLIAALGAGGIPAQLAGGRCLSIPKQLEQMSSPAACSSLQEAFLLKEVRGKHTV